MKFLLNRKVVISLIIAILIITGFIVFKTGKDDIRDNFILTPVVRGNLLKEVSASGTVNPVNVVRVGTQVSGTLEKIYVDFPEPDGPIIDIKLPWSIENEIPFNTCWTIPPLAT